MEAAGFLFGVYPAASLIFDQYQDALRFAKNLKGFRRMYMSFVMDIAYQQSEFENVLYNLMCCGEQPFIPGSISKDKFLNLIQDYDEWSDTRLHTTWKVRLGRHYDFVRERISGVWQDFYDLEELMLVDKLHQGTKTEDWWRAQWAKVKLILDVDENKEKYRIMGERIEQLKKTIESCDRDRMREQESSAQLSKSSIRDIWTKVSTNAGDLYEALRMGWRCHCSLTHKTMLGLHSLTSGSLEGSGRVFNIIVGLPSAGGSSIATGNGTLDEKEVFTSREWEVCLKCAKILTTETSSYLPFATSLPGSQASLLQSDSRTSSPPTNESSTVRDNNNAALSKVSKRRGPTQSIISKLKETFTHSVRPVNHRQAFTVSKQMFPKTKQLFSFESSDTSAALPLPTTVSAPIVSASSLQLGSTSIAEATMVKITNLCDSLANATDGLCLGYLSFAQPSSDCLQLFCQRINYKTNIAFRSSITLTDLLTHGGNFLPRERAFVALTLALSTLHLHQTQWIDQNWGKDDILFRTNGPNIQFKGVYIAKDFPSFTSTPSTAEGSPEDITAKIMRLRNSLECLGIVLAELCLGSSLSSLPEFEGFRGGKGKQAIPPTHRELSEFAKELSTLETVQSTEPLYYTAMENCLFVRNLGKVRLRSYEDVMQELWDNIVSPLEKLHSKWM